MKVFVFAGPNGSGKSTIVKDFFKDERNNGLPFVNADNIAKYDLNYITDLKLRNEKAAQVAEQIRNDHLQAGTSFAYETVLSTDRHIKFLQKAKQEKQAFVSTFYIMTKSADINVERVCHRVSEGGHDVPEEKIRTRYARCMDLMPEVIEVSDFFTLFDNSNQYEIITVKNEGINYLVKRDEKYPLPESLKTISFVKITFEDLLKMKVVQNVEGFSNMLETCGKERL